MFNKYFISMFQLTHFKRTASGILVENVKKTQTNVLRFRCEWHCQKKTTQNTEITNRCDYDVIELNMNSLIGVRYKSSKASINVNQFLKSVHIFKRWRWITANESIDISCLFIFGRFVGEKWMKWPKRSSYQVAVMCWRYANQIAPMN